MSGQGILPLPITPRPIDLFSYTFERPKNFRKIIGHEQAFEIAAAGEHNVLMSGPPGCGKSLFAETFPSILPPLTREAQLEVMSLYQLAKEKLDFPQIAPYRNPHHSASSISIIGGGTSPKPGEISLAHRGILFLDEMAEFPKKTLDMLRQPLGAGKVTISRAQSTVTYPSSFILIAAMNPCPCGYYGSTDHYCTCTSKQIQAYQNRISGPMQDRFDIILTLQSVSLAKEIRADNDDSEEIGKRVMKARQKHRERYQEEGCNSYTPDDLFMEKNPLSQNGRLMIQQWSTKENLSNRVQMKIVLELRSY